MQNLIDYFNQIGDQFPYPLTISIPVKAARDLMYVNKSFLETTGYNKAELIGSSCKILQGRETNQKHIKLLKQALDQKRSIFQDILNYNKQGNPFINRLVLLNFKFKEIDYIIGLQHKIFTPIEEITYQSEELNHHFLNPLNQVINELEMVVEFDSKFSAQEMSRPIEDIKNKILRL